MAVIDILDEPVETLKLLRNENGIDITYHRADVTDTSSLSKAFDAISSQLGTVTCLVNAAGVGIGGPFLECQESTMRKILDINVLGTILCTQIVAGVLRKEGRDGAIVNISSIGGHAGIPGQLNAVYCASKGAILGFTKSLAIEFARTGIRVNSVSPGFFLTKATPGYVDGDVALLQSFEQKVPMGRFADRHELKSMVAFLLTPASSYITGEDIAVDGGVLAA